MQAETPLSTQVVAAITAALSVVMEGRPFTITSIRPEGVGAPGAAPNMWAKAGQLEQHLTRRDFVTRTR